MKEYVKLVSVLIVKHIMSDPWIEEKIGCSKKTFESSCKFGGFATFYAKMTEFREYHEKNSDRISICLLVI